MSSDWNRADYMASYPKYLPYPYAIGRSQRPVPNATAVNWPQSQFAPLYLRPGSASFQPYSFTKNDVPLSSRRPHYTTQNFGPYRRSGIGPGGDIAQLPSSYGEIMSAQKRILKAPQAQPHSQAASADRPECCPLARADASLSRWVPSCSPWLDGYGGSDRAWHSFDQSSSSRSLRFLPA